MRDLLLGGESDEWQLTVGYFSSSDGPDRYDAKVDGLVRPSRPTGYRQRDASANSPPRLCRSDRDTDHCCHREGPAGSASKVSAALTTDSNGSLVGRCCQRGTTNQGGPHHIGSVPLDSRSQEHGPSSSTRIVERKKMALFPEEGTSYTTQSEASTSFNVLSIESTVKTRWTISRICPCLLWRRSYRAGENNRSGLLRISPR